MNNNLKQKGKKMGAITGESKPTQEQERAANKLRKVKITLQLQAFNENIQCKNCRRFIKDDELDYLMQNAICQYHRKPLAECLIEQDFDNIEQWAKHCARSYIYCEKCQKIMESYEAITAEDDQKEFAKMEQALEEKIEREEDMQMPITKPTTKTRSLIEAIQEQAMECLIQETKSNKAKNRPILTMSKSGRSFYITCKNLVIRISDHDHQSINDYIDADTKQFTDIVFKQSGVGVITSELTTYMQETMIVWKPQPK